MSIRQIGGRMGPAPYWASVAKRISADERSRVENSSYDASLKYADKPVECGLSGEILGTIANRIQIRSFINSS